MGTVRTPRRRWRGFAIAAAIAIGMVGVLAWFARSDLPINEARRFLDTNVTVGAARPSAAGEPVASEAVQARFSEARAAFSEERYEDAAKHFVWVVEHDPDGPRAGPSQWNLVRSRLRTGDGNGALAGLEDLLSRYADYLGAESPLLRKGLEEMAAGQLALAQTTLEQMIDAQPDNELVPLAHAQIARIHWIHGEPFKMVESFGRMFASVKDPPRAYVDLGDKLRRYSEGNVAMAKEFSEAASEAGEGFKDIYQYLAARNLLENKRFDRTEEALEKLRRENPHGDFTHIVDLEHAWNLLYNGKPDEALAMFMRLSRKPPPEQAEAFDRFFDLRAELPMGIARSLAAMGHHKEAASAFEGALRDYPNSFYDLENRVGLALAYEHLGEIDKATATLVAAIQAHPDDPNLTAVRQQLTRIGDTHRPNSARDFR